MIRCGLLAAEDSRSRSLVDDLVLCPLSNDGLAPSPKAWQGKRWLARDLWPLQTRANKFAHATQPVNATVTEHYSIFSFCVASRGL